MNSENKSNDFWEEIVVDKSLITKAILHAEKDLATAKRVLESNDFDWCYSITYNSMLQAGRALMFVSGVRPKGEGKHLSVIEFIKFKYSKEFEDILFIFNKMRKKRHLIVYEEVDIVSKEEAVNGIKNAELFIKKVKSIIK
jgi:uncharacterized protein (UPF0332 family)